jgi:hypothetical protein
VTDLLDAVNALTKPTRTKVIRDDGSTVAVSHDPLLIQLADAITSSITGKAGNGGGQSTGNVLNSGALFQASQISSEIGSWCRLARARVIRGDMLGNLIRWRVAFAGGPNEETYYTGVLRGWAGTIRGLLNPRGRFQVTEACVICKASTYKDAEDVDRPFPVVVEYDLADPKGTAVATCQACDEQWSGWDALKELGDELTDTNVNAA